MDDSIWNLVRNGLVEGIDDNKKENMSVVFDLIKDLSRNDDLRILLPIVRRIYPNLSEILEPKDFVDRLLKKLNVGSADFVKNSILIFYAGLRETFNFKTRYIISADITKGNNIDIEAELMAAMATTIAKEFEEEG